MRIVEDTYMGYSPTDEVDAEDVNLSSFEVNETLNPKIWVNEKINSDVRVALLKIADDFVDTLSIDWIEPIDILFTGSLANYNWSEYSDIDLHILYDFKKIYDNTEFVEDYFKAKRNLWNEEHEDISIYGFPVEISVEDSNNPAKSSGVYSLENNEWVKLPKDLSDATLNKDYIKETAAEYMTKIDDVEDILGELDDKRKLLKINKSAERMFDRLKDMRKQSLETEAGEMASDNIVWKVLRREGYLDKLCDIMDVTYDKMMSLG